jgi:TolA-binding protein
LSSLGPEAQALIKAGRSALQPTADDRARIAAGLHARFGGASGTADAAAAAVAKSRALLWSGVSAVVVGLGAGGLFLAGSFGSDTTSATAPAATATAAPAAGTAQSTVAPAPAELAPARVRASPAEVSQVAVRRKPSDRLAEEVELLSRAQTELRAGRFDTALRSLEEHARKFPRGTLAQERRATRIQALCGSGRTREADTELARLAPGSVHEGRTREICAAARKTSP